MTDVLSSLVARARGAEPDLRPRVDPFLALAIDANGDDDVDTGEGDGDGGAVTAPPPAPTVEGPPAEPPRTTVGTTPMSGMARSEPPDGVWRPRRSAPPVPGIPMAHPTIRVVRDDAAERRAFTTVTERVTALAVETRAAAADPAIAETAAPPPAGTVPPPPPMTVMSVVPRVPERASAAVPGAAAPATTLPTVHVTIGRLEIRATTAPASAATPAARRESHIAPLDDYLRQRAGGSR